MRKVLHSKKVSPGLKCVSMDFYESCVYGKQKGVSFVKSGKENKNELHLLMIQLEK